jgi:hypothetical protein
MPANSNAIATVTIQDQDALGPIPSILAQRVQASVIFGSSNTIVYGGYQVVNLVLVNVIPVSTIACPFVFVRNANTSGNAVLTVSVQAQGGAVSPQPLGLAPGGMFLFANNVIAQTAPVTALQLVTAAAVAGQPVVMEYMYAF